MNIKLQTNEQLSATVANGLAGVFVNGVSLSASLSGKADLTALQNYYAKSETSSSSEISNELKKYQLSGNYYQKSETSSANEISTALENAGSKVYFDNRISGVAGSDNLSVVRLSANEYAQMLDGGTCLSNAIYIVEAPNIDAFKRQIKNVAPPTDLSDAATKEYVDNKVSSIHVPADLSAFSNSPGYLISNDVKISYSNQTIWLSSKAYVTSVDCADFIKDGMLSSAELCDTVLVLKFNTDAGSEPISVDLSNFVDNYDEKINDISSKVQEISGIAVETSSSLSAYELTADMFRDVSSIALSAETHTSSLTWNPVQLWGDDVTIGIDNGYITIFVNGSSGYGYEYPFDPSQTTYIWKAGNDWAGENDITAIYSPAYSKNALGLATLADISSIPTEALSAGTLARIETRWICDPAHGVGGAVLSVVIDEANRKTVYLYSDGYQCSLSKPYDPTKTTYVWDSAETDMGYSVTATYSPSQNILGLVTYPDISSFSVQQISAAATKVVPVYDYSSLSITVIPQTVDNKEISVVIEDGQIKPTLDGSTVGSNIKTFYNEPYVYIWKSYDWEGAIDLSVVCAYDTHYVNQIGLAMLSDVTGVSAQLSNYYLKSETSSAAEISSALEQKSSVMFVEWED